MKANKGRVPATPASWDSRATSPAAKVSPAARCGSFDKLREPFGRYRAKIEVHPVEPAPGGVVSGCVREIRTDRGQHHQRRAWSIEYTAEQLVERGELALAPLGAQQFLPLIDDKQNRGLAGALHRSQALCQRHQDVYGPFICSFEPITKFEPVVGREARDLGLV